MSSANIISPYESMQIPYGSSCDFMSLSLWVLLGGVIRSVFLKPCDALFSPAVSTPTVVVRTTAPQTSTLPRISAI